jgi:pimeloyl-ACP methyl ester carboxylesterase
MDQFTRDGLTFDVRDGGPADGETVVLLHGFPQDNTAWSAIEPILHEAGYRTLAPDQRGYSPGARPAGRKAYTQERIADDVVAMLDAAGVERAHVVGHDWGGSVVWVLAGRDDGRVLSCTALSTPHPAALLQAMRTSSQGLRSWYMAFFQLPWLPEQLISRVLVPQLVHDGLPRPYAEHDAQRMAEPGALTGALNWYRAMPYGLRGSIHRSRVPSLYVWGAKDTFLGRKAAELTERYVAAPYTFTELPDAGHWLPETHPTQVATLILDHLRSTPPPTP